MTILPIMFFIHRTSKLITPKGFCKIIFLTVFLICLYPFYVTAQNKKIPYLEREVTVVALNRPIEEILSDISNQAGFVFSYSPDIIHSDKKVSLTVQKKPVRFVLNQLFNNEIDYKARNKYVILNKQPNSKNEILKVEGYVYDSKTGEKVTNASIYDKNLMVSAITDEYGYFKVNLPSSKSISDLRVSKAGYSDTAMLPVIDESKLRRVELSMQSMDSANDKKWQSFINLEKIAPKWLIPKKIKINALNINDSVFKAVQFSLIPYVTTNHFLGGNIVNDFSFNCTVGYIKGVRIAEFGGIINIVQDNASYVQFGGVGNIVGGTFKGGQFGGVFNYASNVEGVQIAGTVNHSGDAKFQVSGVLNKAKHNNIQVAGTINIADQSNIQAAGIVNLANDLNFQIGGVLNHASNNNILQVAGVLNNTKENSAIQVAGCINRSSGSTEIQITSLLNYAQTVGKFQIGIINISDTCMGLPIGLINIVKSGYHKIEVSADEVFPFNISYRTGVKRIHSSFSLGINPFRFSTPVWTYGYGLGTSFGKSDKYVYDLDLSFHPVIFKGNLGFSGMLNRVYFGMDKRLNSKMSLAFGLTYNFYITNTDNSDYEQIFAKIPPYKLTNSTSVSGTNLETWIGGRLALRMF